MKLSGLTISRGSAGKLSILALLLAVLGLTFSNLLAGTPEPTPPKSSLFYTPPLARWEDQRVADQAADFVSRPLFSESRRPVQNLPVEPETSSDELQTVKAPLQTLEGWSLLGIFTSGEVIGAIVRQPDGSRSRVQVGDRAGDWRLLAVQARSVYFQSVLDGSEAELSMVLTSLDGLVRDVSLGDAVGENPRGLEPSAVPSGSETEGGEQSAPQPTRRDPRTFGGFYKDD